MEQNNERASEEDFEGAKRLGEALAEAALAAPRAVWRKLGYFLIIAPIIAILVWSTISLGIGFIKSFGIGAAIVTSIVIGCKLAFE